jgi:NAD(P)-dependent dehydrogenase (short-subunit alcohol dehydrogenase family)
MNADKLKSLFDLSGRTAVVTGGTRGIGFALAQGYLTAGANVVVTGRAEDGCRAAQDALDSLGRVAAIAAHMGDLDQVKELVEKTVETFRWHRHPRQQRGDVAAAATRRNHP